MALYPYKRELSPSIPESLPEHTNREYEKIERAIRDLVAEMESHRAYLITLGYTP